MSAPVLTSTSSGSAPPTTTSPCRQRPGPRVDTRAVHEDAKPDRLTIAVQVDDRPGMLGGLLEPLNV